jgi:hypothetical protein
MMYHRGFHIFSEHILYESALLKCLMTIYLAHTGISKCWLGTLVRHTFYTSAIALQVNSRLHKQLYNWAPSADWPSHTYKTHKIFKYDETSLIRDSWKVGIFLSITTLMIKLTLPKMFLRLTSKLNIFTFHDKKIYFIICNLNFKIKLYCLKRHVKSIL